ncbi:hypothetical protein ACFZB4_18360 [Streptomyces pseudovenezuelae]|uniref:hypothetical protein n=1 Tax=Streptomyces pseudovenezuelae TaxID=67350 RepID=UPI0036EA34A3
MGDTFGGVWTKPRDDGRGHSQRELQDRASFDNQKSEGCGSLFLLSILATTAVAAIRKGRA